MPGNKVVVGPWPRGLNQRDNPELIADDSLVSIRNFDLRDDGSLMPRRACRKAFDPTSTTSGPRSYTALGSISLGSEEFAVFEQAHTDYPSQASQFVYTKNPTAAWSSAPFTGSGSGRYSAVVQYNNFIYFVPFKDNTAAKGFRTATLTASPTLVDSLPGGYQALMLKDRMFVIGGTRIYYSKATDPTVWSAPDGGFFDVNPGDGQDISKVIYMNNSLYIFKRDATWAFTYTDDPSLDGVLRQISYDMGAYDAIVYNNEVYTVDSRSVHNFINNYFQDVAKMLNFTETDTLDSSNLALPRLNVIDRNLIVGPTGTGRYYCMNFDTGAWTEHVYPEGVEPKDTGVLCRDASGSYTLFANDTIVSYIQHSRSDSRVIDTDSAGANYCPEYYFVTKHISFKDNAAWKRLYWWSLDGYEPSDPQIARPIMIVNGRELTIGTNKVFDRTTTISTRFRSLALGYKSEAAPVESATLQAAPNYKAITMYVTERTPIAH